MSKLLQIKDGRYYINFFGIKITFKKKQNNTFILTKKNGAKIKNPRIKAKNLKVIFKGSNSSVEIHEPIDSFKNTTIIVGDNSKISVKSTKYPINNLLIDALQGYSNVNIGEDFSVASGNFFVDIGSNLTIGNDCMFSESIGVRTGDAHQLYYNNELVRPKDIVIGNHCWIGLNSFILKNTVLPDNTIVGTGAIVTKAFETPNCAVGGNPARILKENMYWDRAGINEFGVDKIIGNKETTRK